MCARVRIKPRLKGPGATRSQYRCVVNIGFRICKFLCNGEAKTKGSGGNQESISLCSEHRVSDLQISEQWGNPHPLGQASWVQTSTDFWNCSTELWAGLVASQI